MAIGAKKKKKIMSSEELSSFCDQIALMLSSGMTLRDGIEMLAEDEMKGTDKVHPYTNLYIIPIPTCTRWWMRPVPFMSP